jgi:hypothetical protein
MLTPGVMADVLMDQHVIAPATSRAPGAEMSARDDSELTLGPVAGLISARRVEWLTERE